MGATLTKILQAPRSLDHLAEELALWQMARDL